MNLKERAKKLKYNIPAVAIALKDKRTPIIAKIVAFLVVGYALSPIDLIPDFIPVLGYLDDIILLPLMIALVVKLIPDELFDIYLSEAKGMWENGKPKKWYYSFLVVGFYLMVGIVIYFLIKK
jgi:uncharacterized membrane protein YkvA (DUF1232 family)